MKLDHHHTMFHIQGYSGQPMPAQIHSHAQWGYNYHPGSQLSMDFNILSMELTLMHVLIHQRSMQGAQQSNECM